MEIAYFRRGLRASLGADLPTTLPPDAQIGTLLAYHFRAQGTPMLPPLAVERFLKHWKDYKRDGMSDGWILNEMKRQKIAITSGAYIATDAQVVAFVGGMSRIARGDTPEDPAERPSWAEAYDMGLGKILSRDKLPLLALGALALGGLYLFGGRR